MFPILPDELTPDLKVRMDDWTTSIQETLKERFNPSTEEEDAGLFEYKLDHSVLEDDDDSVTTSLPESDDIDFDGFDKYLSAKVSLPKGEEFMSATVTKRLRGADGNYIGKSNSNPILDTALYEVQFADGSVEAYTANLIAENIYSQVDENGHEVLKLDQIVDHDTDESAVRKGDEWVITGGNKYRMKTTRGWKLQAQWKDGTTTWEKLKDLKQCFPVEVAEYALSADLLEEPAFAWWAPYTLKKRDRIVKAQASRYARTTHKFGIELPKTVDHALELDKKNGNNLWAEAIKKEMATVGTQCS